MDALSDNGSGLINPDHQEVISPLREYTLDINDHVNLKEKIRNSTAKRNYLADEKGINAMSQNYLLDKALIILTAYAEDDQELRMFKLYGELCLFSVTGCTLVAL